MPVHNRAQPSPTESAIVVTRSNRTWIFVSHASADLEPVREVRNYLERKDASPLLFHLLALKHEDQFWPVIEREIAERDFFLLCESEAADQSEWVRRERAAVERAAMHRSKRIGSIRVDGGALDFAQLDRFIGTMRVFPSYGRRDRDQVVLFLRALESRGFEVFDDLRDIRAGDAFAEQLGSALSGAAAYGFVLIFLSGQSLRSEFMRYEIELAARLNARIVPVLLERGLDLSAGPPSLVSFQHFDATLEPHLAPQRLADFLHAQAI
jgi:hypothetical protein